MNRVWFWKLIDFPRFLMPTKIRNFADPETYYIDRFLKTIPTSQPGEVALDAGAGTQNKKLYLVNKGYEYQSCDFEDVFADHALHIQTFISSVDDLPMPDNTYDLVISVQVLEHLEKPETAISEMLRVLKPKGKLFLSTNFLYPRHGSPYDYFRFTAEGLNSLVKRNNARALSIAPHGGFFALLAQILHEVPIYLRNFIIFGKAYPVKGDKPKNSRLPFFAAMCLPIFALNALTQLACLILHKLDFLDTTHRYTLGYSMIVEKMNTE